MSTTKRLLIPTMTLAAALLFAAGCGEPDRTDIASGPIAGDDDPLSAALVDGGETTADPDGTGRFEPTAGDGTDDGPEDGTDDGPEDGTGDDTSGGDDDAGHPDDAGDADDGGGADSDPDPGNDGGGSDGSGDGGGDDDASGGGTDQGHDDGETIDPAPRAPVFTHFFVAHVDPCSATDPTDRPGDEPVTVAWSVDGADEIYLAIDNEFGPYETGLAASGTLDVPGPGCEDNTYYVVASNDVGRTVRQAVRSAFPPRPEPPTPAPTTKPEILSFHVSAVETCDAGGTGFADVTASWSVDGADEIYLAIDNEFGPYETGLAASGSLAAPGPGCGEDNVYYLVAKNDNGRTTARITRTA